MIEIKISNRKNKKYMALVNGVWYHFGDKNYQQYKDVTPLRVYSNLDHLDKDRRRLYHIRHKNNVGIPSQLAKRYLW